MRDAEGNPLHSPLLHPVTVGEDAGVDAVVLAAARSLLRVESRVEAARVLHAAVSSLGGVLVPASESHTAALPLDVSLGVGGAQLVGHAAGEGAGLRRLSHILPALVEDALVAAARADSFEQEARRASVDELTGVASRREIPSRLRAASAGDVVCLLDFDELKELNDTRGHCAGDEALQRFGAALIMSFRDDDFVGRYGGDEFLVVLKATPLAVAVERLRSLARGWAGEDGQLPTVSAGVAAVGVLGGSAALRAADLALYRAKRNGRNLVEGATASDPRIADAP